ncbi:MAG: transporter substrate-binding domain-containing protein, partial [Campylobacterota bacterium]|nr:transporter substrate-binding domain-containing protein [Campylobacterota bacterium]
YFIYTPAYDFSPSYIVTKQNDTKIKNLHDLENKTIYLKTNSISHKMVEANLDNIHIIDIPTMNKMYQNLSTSSSVDAMITYFASKEKLKKYDLKIAKTMYERYGETSIGIHHKYPHLASIIKKAYDIIPKTEISKIRDKRWAVNTKVNYDFSEEDIKYLKNKKVLKICTNTSWKPIEFFEDGTTKGISIDILNFLQDNLDLKYKYIKTNSWKQSQEFLKDKKCDILPSAIQTKKRSKYAKFTKPYLNYELAIITKDDKPLSQTIESFLAKTMSRAQGSGLITKIKQLYPTINIKETEDTRSSFEAVIDGDVDFTIATLPVLQYYKNKYGLKGLQIVGYTDMKYNLSMAVRDDETQLKDILNIALSKLSPQTYKIVHDKWANVEVVQETDWTLIFQIIGILVILLALILWNNRKLQSMVDEKTADIAKQKSELEIMITSFDKNVIFSRTDTTGHITHVSDAFCKISGYTYDELIGQPHNIVRHPDMKREVFKEIWDSLAKESCIKVEVKNRKKDGGSYWVESKFEVDYDSAGKIIGYSALRIDITSKKEVEDLSANLEITVEKRTKELSEERKFIDSVINSQSSIVITTNGESIRTVNQAFFDFFGLETVESFRDRYGRCICDTFYKKHKQGYLQKTTNGLDWIEYMKQNPNETHKVIIELHGKKHIFSINAESFIFKNEKLNTIVFNDITELEKIREDIEVSKKSTEQILANILLPVLITSKEKRTIVYANKFAQDLYEIGEKDIIDAPLDNVYRLTDGPEEIIRQLTTYGKVDGLEEHITTHTGKEFIGLLSVTPLMYNNQECYIGMTVDITKQKDMENEVRAIHKHTRESIEYASLIQGALIPDKKIL